MPDTTPPPVDLAMTIPSEQDGDVFVRLCDLGELLTKPLMPEKQLEVLEDIIIKNWQVAASARVRMEWALEHIRQHELWKCHRVRNEHGETVQEFQTFRDYQQWLVSHFTKLSDRAINYRLANVRIVQSLGFGLEEAVDLLDDPANVQQVARLFETDGLSQFEGFVSPQVEQNLREMVGDTAGELDAQELAKTATEMLLTSAGAVSGKVDELLHSGEWRHKFVFENNGQGPLLKFVGWKVGGHERYEQTFVLRRGEELHPQALAELNRYRRQG